MNIEKLNARLVEIASRAEAIGGELDVMLDRDELTDDETTRFTELEDESKELRVEADGINAKLTARAAVAELAETGANVIPGSGEPGLNRGSDPYDIDARYAPPAEVRGRALTAIAEQPHTTDPVREQLTMQVERNDDPQGSIARRILLTSSEAYRNAWAKAVTGRQMALTRDEADALERAMSLTDNAGGYAVPAPIDPTLIMTGAGSTNPFRQISTVKTITNDVWKGLSVGAVTASWDGEAAEVSDDTGTYVGPSITAHKAQAFIPASIEITQDYPGLAADLGALFAEAKDDLEATAFATGTGSSQPYGVVSRVAAVTASRVDATTDNSFGAVDVYATLAAVPAKHQPGASWACHLATINLMRQFATANNYHAFITDMTGDTPQKLLGKPLFESSAMDSALATADDDILLAGDFRNYVIADRVGLTVEFIPHLFATGSNRPSGQRGFYAYWRVGADTVNNDAFRILRV